MEARSAVQVQNGDDTRLPLLKSVFRRVLNVWSDQDAGSRRLRWIFFAALGAIFAVTFFTGAVPTMVSGHDDFFFLENGWRALNGLRPHIDFSSSWGPLMFVVLTLGMKISGASPNGIGYGTAIFGLVIGLWGFRLGRARLAPAARMLFPLYLAMLICAPYALGEWPLLTTHAMLYNRYGYALVGLVIIECFQRRGEGASASEEWIGGLSTGAATALALSLKATYFVAGGLIIAVSLLFDLKPRRLAGMALSFGAVIFADLVYLRFGIHKIIEGYRIAAGARASMVSPLAPIWTIEANLGPLWLALAVGVAASLLRFRPRTWLGPLELPLLAGVVYLGDIGILMGNTQYSCLPLLPVFALLVASRFADERRKLPESQRESELPYHACLVLLCGLLFIPQFTSDAVGVATGAMRKAMVGRTHPLLFEGANHISDLVFYDHPAAIKGTSGSTYVNYVNEGEALLRRYCNSSDRVMNIDMQNPFPYAMGWQPEHGGMATLSTDSFNEKFRPSDDEFFGDTTVVMIPKHPSRSARLFSEIYRIWFPAISQRFELKAESDWWMLYKRR